MSYTIKELDEAVQTGWNGTYTHWKTNEVTPYHAEGWHSLIEEIDYRDKSFELPDIGTVTLVESHGGGEGSGEERWIVFKVVSNPGTRIAEERLFRRNGYYASFHGSDFDGPTEEVQPTEKSITVWTAVA